MINRIFFLECEPKSDLSNLALSGQHQPGLTWPTAVHAQRSTRSHGFRIWECSGASGSWSRSVVRLTSTARVLSLRKTDAVSSLSLGSFEASRKGGAESDSSPFRH